MNKTYQCCYISIDSFICIFFRDKISEEYCTYDEKNYTDLLIQHNNDCQALLNFSNKNQTVSDNVPCNLSVIEIEPKGGTITGHTLRIEVCIITLKKQFKYSNFLINLGTYLLSPLLSVTSIWR